ncbi:MAG: sulfite exporter TauE/SafE family protein [Capsulimonadales bacterium]|nr:sulfite exporter TauE/SafE family protein [Capsulimonadales bacterium]
MVINWDYWFVFPYAVFVAVMANASGFSGAVLFQPFFNFVLKLPIANSIATGIATETIGMTSGALQYVRLRQVDFSALRFLLLPILVGVAAGLFLFVNVPRDILRLLVGVVISAISLYQFLRVAKGLLGTGQTINGERLKRWTWVSVFSGLFSACTGTGVAEMNQPLLEEQGELATKRANATAILLEAIADWTITIVNLKLGFLRPDILLFSATGVLIGAQIGALISRFLPDRLLKLIFAVAVLFIGGVYIVTTVGKFLSGAPLK